MDGCFVVTVEPCWCLFFCRTRQDRTGQDWLSVSSCSATTATLGPLLVGYFIDRSRMKRVEKSRREKRRGIEEGRADESRTKRREIEKRKEKEGRTRAKGQWKNRTRNKIFTKIPSQSQELKDLFISFFLPFLFLFFFFFTLLLRF